MTPRSSIRLELFVLFIHPFSLLLLHPSSSFVSFSTLFFFLFSLLKKKQDDSDAIQEAHTIGIHGYILIYSVASKSSYEKMKVLNDKILTACGTDKVPRVLCGNKMDLHLERLNPSLPPPSFFCLFTHHPLFKTKSNDLQGGPTRRGGSACTIVGLFLPRVFRKAQRKHWYVSPLSFLLDVVLMMVVSDVLSPCL